MKKVSFCGISGSGMSSLAQVLKLSGYDVCGSDRNFDLGRDLKSKTALEKLGIKILPQDGSAVSTDLDFVCASTAVEDTIPDIKAAKEKGVAIKLRPQLLAEIFHGYKYGVAVGGTSGKTTTTAMIGFILDKVGYYPCMINGGLLKDYENQSGIPNIIYNQGDICVVEADESNGSIELYKPYISVINNISEDHKSLDELQNLFQHFADRSTHAVVLNDDYELCRLIQTDKAVSFSIKNPQADFFAADIRPEAGGTSYVFRGKRYTLNLIGAFNVANAMAAIAACAGLGVDPLVAAQTLCRFNGTKRRLEILGAAKNITVIDDFAHNPDKVTASVSALRQYNGRLIIIFQPHGFGPMRSLGKEIMRAFADNMGQDDILIMPEIFFVGGTVSKDISSAHLIEYIKSLGHEKSFFFATKQQAAGFAVETMREGDRIVVMGARDNSLTDLGYEILRKAENE